MLGDNIGQAKLKQKSSIMQKSVKTSLLIKHAFKTLTY